MSSYATVDQFEDYVEGWDTTNAEALERLLERATRDLDRAFAARPTITSGVYAGHKLDPTTLAKWEADALARATCAQAEYRELYGELAWTGAGGVTGDRVVKRVKGPDFETEYAGAGTVADGTAGRIGPKVAVELEPIAHLRGLIAEHR